MYKAIHRRDDIDRLYVPRKEGERGLTCFEGRVVASIQWQEGNPKKSKERQIEPQEKAQAT